MAKTAYNQRASIDRSRLDHVIAIEVWDVKIKPMPVKVILFWFAVMFFIMWLMTKSPVSDAPVWLLIFIAVWVVVVAGFFGTQMKTGEMRFSLIPVLFDYFQPGERVVKTRTSSEPYDFMSIVGIRDIDETGLIHFLDGSVGKGYQIVGSASRLLFSTDQAYMVDRVDAFWRKVGVEQEWIFLTMKEPQRVFRQIAHTEKMNRRLNALGMYHSDLRELLEERYDIAAKDVGGKFNSIHQYLVIKAQTPEDLQAGHTLLAAEVEASSLMFKQCVMLDAQATVDMLGAIYRHRTSSEVI